MISPKFHGEEQRLTDTELWAKRERGSITVVTTNGRRGIDVRGETECLGDL